MRQIILDTETTGLEPSQGHRIIEIGCVELINRRMTDNRFHIYLNPDREIDQGAIEVHGITNEFLADKPRFAEVANDFMNFVRGSELVIHNAPFDVGFLNHELKLMQYKESLEDVCSVLDTLVLARKMHPGQKNSLDALCKRYEVSNAHRELHGALLDAEILADVYLAMTGGQTRLSLDGAGGDGTEESAEPIRKIRSGHASLKVIRATDEEIQAHNERLDAIEKVHGTTCVWRTD
jgi:DNA polymerase-3 subunit epsilon